MELYPAVEFPVEFAARLVAQPRTASLYSDKQCPFMVTERLYNELFHPRLFSFYFNTSSTYADLITYSSVPIYLLQYRTAGEFRFLDVLQHHHLTWYLTMAGLKSWLRGSSSTQQTSTATPKTPTASSTTTLPTSNAAQTSPSKAGLSDIEHAMESAELIMNDDIAGAEALFRTRQATSTFHQLGLGVCAFMTSILGFEKEAMTEAPTVWQRAKTGPGLTSRKHKRRRPVHPGLGVAPQMYQIGSIHLRLSMPWFMLRAS